MSEKLLIGLALLVVALLVWSSFDVVDEPRERYEKLIASVQAERARGAQEGQAWLTGLEAFEAGSSVYQNPYQPETELEKQFIFGWFSGKEINEREPLYIEPEPEPEPEALTVRPDREAWRRLVESNAAQSRDRFANEIERLLNPEREQVLAQPKSPADRGLNSFSDRWTK